MSFTPAHLILQDMSDMTTMPSEVEAPPKRAVEDVERELEEKEQEWQQASEAANAEAYERGRADGVAIASAEYEVKLNELVEQHKRELVQTREHWDREFGASIWARMAEDFNSIREALAEDTARALVPFLGRQIEDQAVLKLVASVADVVSTEKATKLEVSGPEKLIEGFQAAFPDDRLDVSYTKIEQSEIRIVVDQTVIETRLSEWMAKLESAVT